MNTEKKIRLFRQSSGISQSDMALRLRIAQPTLCQLEKKGIQKLATAKKYAKILGCNWQDLMD